MSGCRKSRSISKIKLDKFLEGEIYNQFWYYLGKINNSNKSASFYTDFFTETEKLIFAKRFIALILIDRGKTVSEIRNAIHLSNSTITSISFLIKNASPETKKILNGISREKNLEKLFDKIEEILDKLPPKIYTNWSEEYKNRRKRIFERQDRQTLR